MKPQLVARELSLRLQDDAIITSDSGTIAAWTARHICIKRGQMYSLSGNLGSMANGMPYMIAAQIAYPDRQCVGFVGDDGFSMLIAEFATAVKYNLPVKIVVIKNNALGQIKWEQMVFLGNPEYGVDLQPIDFVAFAQLDQLAFIRQHIPMDVASGEYGYDSYSFRDVLLAGVVDILHADVTRCLSVTGWLVAAGFQVRVPQGTLCCGRPLYDRLMLTQAKHLLRQTLDALRPEIEAGTPVVGLEPSCVAVFRDELVNLFPHDQNAKRLKQQAFTLGGIPSRRTLRGIDQTRRAGAAAGRAQCSNRNPDHRRWLQLPGADRSND